MTVRLAAATVALFVMLAAPFTAPAARDSAAETAQAFQASLLEVMKNAKTLGVKGRFDSLAPIIEKTFYLPGMIATASGPYWRAASADQRKRLIEAFRKMSVSSVATLFDGYDGESFRVLWERETQGRTVLVDTEIVRTDDDPIGITYVTAEIKGRWWVLDVIVDGGISELKTRRSEYLKLLKEGGPEKLIAALEARADHLITGMKKSGAQGTGD